MINTIVDKIINLHAERSRRAKGGEGTRRGRGPDFAAFCHPDPEVNGFPCTPLSNAVGFFDLSRRTADFYPFLSSVGERRKEEEGGGSMRSYQLVCARFRLRPHSSILSFLLDRLGPASGLFTREFRASARRATNASGA